MTTDATPASNTPAPAAPAPDTPEYVAAMVAAADASNGVTPTPAPVETPPVDPNAPTPKLTDTPAVEPKEGDTPPAETTKEGEGDTPAVFDFAKAFNDGSLILEFNSEKPSEQVMESFAKALGLTPEQANQIQAQFRAGSTAMAAQAEAQMFEAAGGKAQFNDLISWGQQNLSPADKVRYEGMLNSPDRQVVSDAISLLQAKRGSGGDPRLVNVNGRPNGSNSGAFRDRAEMVTAMADPRYQTSEAYRQEVAQKLRISSI